MHTSKFICKEWIQTLLEPAAYTTDMPVTFRYLYIVAELMSKNADFERLENLVDKTQHDKRKLGVRVGRLVQTGELQL